MIDHDSLFGDTPLSMFHGALSQVQMVSGAVEEAFGSKAQDIQDGMRSGHVSQEHQDELRDLLLDLLAEKGKPTVEFVGREDFDEFPIIVMHFGPVFWVTATDFDDIGFFSDVIAASEAATTNFEPFITYAAEQYRQNT